MAVAETFVDPVLYQGTCYKVSGWTRVAETAGYARGAKGDFYQAHKSPKHLWVKELEKGACQKLRGKALPEAWAGVESLTAPRCRATPAQIMSLMELLGKEVTEFRRDQALAYPAAGMLALIGIATFAGVMHGQRDLAAFGRTCSQAQLRAFKFRRAPRSKRREAPGETTFMRVLAGVDAAQVERALLLWQDQVLGPAEDPLVAVDGKKLRHAGGVELVSAFGVESGRWMDNIFIERLWRSYKYEDLYLKEYATLAELEAGIRQWMERYNTWRPHQNLGNKTPAQVYASDRKPATAEIEKAA